MFSGSGELKILTEQGVKKISNLIEFKKKICSLLWGFITPQKDVRWKEGKTFDDFFASCESEFKKKLRSMENQKIRVESKARSVPTRC